MTVNTHASPHSRNRGFMRRFTPLAALLVVSMIAGGTALADNLLVDGDGLIPVASNALNLGSVCAGSSTSKNALLAIQRAGNATATNTFVNNSSTTVSAAAPGGTNGADVSTSFADNGITLPGNWSGATNNTTSADTATSVVTATGVGGPGSRTATVVYTATGQGNNGTLARTATLTITWSVSACDTTPPVITPNVSGTLGTNGWYTSDVSVDWTVIDAESSISSMTGCGTTAITADTAGQTITCSATSLGGTDSQSVTIKVDATPPSISGSATPAPNGNGWNNGPVSVAFSCDDALSGLASCSPATTLAGEGADQMVNGIATDGAGNSSSTTVSGINIDTTAPAVSLVGGPANGDIHYFGYLPAAPTCSASDALSTIDGPCSVTGYGTTIGNHTVTATASDRAGNSGSAAASYRVEAWTLRGFTSPVDMGYLNTVKGGSTVPLKFRVFAGSTELTDISAIANLRAVAIACPGATAPLAPVEELSAAGATVLRYDATGGQFIYNWKTGKNPGKCYQVILTTIDGSVITADFKLT